MWRAFLVASIILGASAVFVIVDSQNLILEDGYYVEVDAPYALDWTLWIPRPSIQMNTETTGTIYSIWTVDTQYGQMDNITGRGHVIFDRTSRRNIMAAEAPVNYIFGNVDYSGRNGSSSFEVWRKSADPSSSIYVEGFISHTTHSHYGYADCGGGGYSDYAQEGWSEPGRIFTDCGFPTDPGPCISFLLFILALGLGMAAVAAARVKISTISAPPMQKGIEEAEHESPPRRDERIR